ncbi:mitochondrial inner-membrane-bound regulator domain-containing protein [Ophiocordyceps camponoti-floridani]|uniref:Mitochondrial inner-membrane-bound regulator domain-containing protein n=1 Tax=Ophiocordyceps camponoti-floridani TaxID=2030778 RepID=A0A8H4Q2T0_9HYPO|nr:mitochondrial inner-membrane-bound regulator domain-containing protein [Ophiocordyceps camponoti-floridani]
MRFASGPAVRTKEYVEAILSGASDFGKSSSERGSDVRSSLEVEALLSGSAEFPASPRRTEQKRPKKQAEQNLSFDWVRISKQGRRRAIVDEETRRPETLTGGGFQFDMDDEPVGTDDKLRQVESREGTVQLGAEDEPQRLSQGKLDIESQVDEQVEPEDEDGGSGPVPPRDKPLARAKASPISHAVVQQPDYGLDEQDESESQQYLPPLKRSVNRQRSSKFTHASLGFVSLGKPAAALITTDINVSRRQKAKERELSLIDESDSTGLPLSCEDVLVDPTNDESDADALKRLCRNLDELRPKDKTSLTEHEVKRLAKKLMDGFTMQQLVDYYRRDMTYGLHAHDAPCYDWIVEHEPWQAIRPISLKRLKPKKRQAILVVTQKWKLDVTEQIEGQGSTTIKLKPDIFQLIAQPWSRVLKSLSDDCLDSSNRERVSSDPETCRLSIHSRRLTADIMLARLDESIRTSKTRIISVEAVNQDDLTDATLNELSRITNTALEHHPNEKTLSVSWIPDNSSEGNAQTEDAADMILRLLFPTTPPPTTNVHLITKTPDQISFVPHLRDTRSLSWRDKLRQWCRCVTPISTNSNNSNNDNNDNNNNNNNNNNNTHLPSTILSILPPKTPTRQLTSKQHSATSSTNPPPRTLKPKSHRVLTPIVPHPASLTPLSPETDQEDDPIRSTSIVLHFSPDPQPHPSPPSALPSPSTRQQASPLRHPPRPNPRSHLPKSTTDILLPSSPIDVRILHLQSQPITLPKTP